ncbi:MAG: ABC transporter ATP-binding protein [Planctomycetota bacterium]
MIEASKLTMHYGSFVALRDASFSVGKGEVLGLLGPNGAGKSTTLKILSTFLYPTRGKATVGGKDVRTEAMAVRRMIGYLPESLPLYTDMEVSEYLHFVGKSRGLSGRDLKKRIDWVVAKAGLKGMFRRVIGNLSKGYRQRTAMAQALIHDPAVVIFDEPTSGLDPHQIIEVRQLIRELAQEKTIVFSTHILQEVEAVTERLVIINRGRIVADGTQDELARRALEGERVYLEITRPGQDPIPALKKVPGARKVGKTGGKGDMVAYHVEAARGTDLLSPVYEVIKRNGWQLHQLRNDPFSLEETFLALTESESTNGPKGGAA